VEKRIYTLFCRVGSRDIILRAERLIILHERKSGMGVMVTYTEYCLFIN